jgi:Cys-tRNA(Pro)/Cys-tRNA(Cys) deacylase
MTANPTPEPPGADAAAAAVVASGVPHTVVRHGPVASLEEAAAARGVPPSAVIKTLVVRRADEDFLLVLVPGDRGISWRKLRGLLGVSRLSMPDAGTARAATGYARGTITPFGARGAWPVVADARIPELATVSIGGGDHGVAITLTGSALMTALATLTGGVQTADVTEPLEPPVTTPA